MRPIEFEGETYRIEFRRVMEKNHTLPFTIATLVRKTPTTDHRGVPIWIEERSAKVGCWPWDVYTNEAGRLQALRKLLDPMGARPFAKPLREALWDAYHARKPVRDPRACPTCGHVPSNVAAPVGSRA